MGGAIPKTPQAARNSAPLLDSTDARATESFEAGIPFHLRLWSELPTSIRHSPISEKCRDRERRAGDPRPSRCFRASHAGRFSFGLAHCAIPQPWSGQSTEGIQWRPPHARLSWHVGAPVPPEPSRPGHDRQKSTVCLDPPWAISLAFAQLCNPINI